MLGSGDTADALRDRLGRAGYSIVDEEQARWVLYVPDIDPDEDDLAGTVRLTRDVADIVGRLAARDDRDEARLWIVTEGVRDADSPSAVRQSGLWGIAAVISAEQPQVWGGLIDITSGDITGGDNIDTTASALATVLPNPAKAILSLRDGEFFMPTLAPIADDPVREPLRCRPDAAYLITGGLGALGLRTADWLADRGARRVILAGRTGLPPRRGWDDPALDTNLRSKIDAIRALELRGVSVEVAALDIGSRDAVLALVAKRDEDGAPPIRGIIHGAGLTESQLLTGLDEDRLRTTLWPKVAGAQVLHEVFPPDSVDFMYMTASAGTVFGVPGQGAYAAGNAYLDGLARARHRQGGHGASLDWVAWQGLGFGSDAQVVVDELARHGSRPVTAPEAFAAWEYASTFDIAHLVMAPMPPTDASSDPSAAGAARPARAWSEMAPEEVLAELKAGLRAVLAIELRIADDEVDTDRPFAEMGLNSVMAMSIRREVEQLAGIELSATMLWNHPTIGSLAAHLAEKVAPQAAAEADDESDDSGDSLLDSLFDSVEN